MFTIGVSKVRLICFVIFCLVVWKTFHYFAHLHSIQLMNFVNGSLHSPIKSKVPGSPVLVSIYYEALCSDSRNFILKQLVPTYEKAQNIIEIDLIPYGKATTTENNGMYKFECQHSYIECEANKIHACVLHQPFSKKMHLKYVACMIKDNMIPHEVGKKCAEELDVDYNPIEECSNGKEGARLLKEYGDRTHAVSPKITFIPTIQLNNSSQVPLVYILKDLFKETCKTFGESLPNECL